MRKLVACSVILFGCRAQSGYKASELDRERLKRGQAQIDLIQAKANEVAAPIIAERNEIIARNCKAAGVEPKECDVNTDTGEVRRIEQKGKQGVK